MSNANSDQQKIVTSRENAAMAGLLAPLPKKAKKKAATKSGRLKEGGCMPII
jgi:hypothetical protein